MSKNTYISSVEEALSADIVDAIEILPVRAESDFRNQLLMFFKPEVFLVNPFEFSERILDLGFSKLDEYEASVSGMYLLPGSKIDELGLMSRHYGYINQLSTRASELVTETELKVISEKLGIKDIENYTILGGHEFLTKYPAIGNRGLDSLWFQESSAKIRSGFYVRAVTYEDAKIILVNGFHPEQLAHYTAADRKLLLLLVESNTDWRVLRDEMVGGSFPHEAPRHSIRGILHQSPSDYGFESVTIANNGVHLSAGPSEALFEIQNFFGGLRAVDFVQTPPVVVRRLLDEGFSYDDVEHLLSNPFIELEEASNTLHNLVEHKDTEDLLSLWKRYRAGAAR